MFLPLFMIFEEKPYLLNVLNTLRPYSVICKETKGLETIIGDQWKSNYIQFRVLGFVRQFWDNCLELENLWTWISKKLSTVLYLPQGHEGKDIWPQMPRKIILSPETSKFTNLFIHSFILKIDDEYLCPTRCPKSWSIKKFTNLTFYTFLVLFVIIYLILFT